MGPWCCEDKNNLRNHSFCLIGNHNRLLWTNDISYTVWPSSSTQHCILCFATWTLKPWTIIFIMFKEKVEFWEEVKNNLWVLSLYYAFKEEHQIKNVPWKAWLFKCLNILNILNMACNIIKIGTDFYATCLCSPIYIFLCTVLVTLQRLGQFLIILMIPEPCSTHQYIYFRWPTFSDRFHNVSFTMQSHDQNSTLSLMLTSTTFLFFQVSTSLRVYKLTRSRVRMVECRLSRRHMVPSSVNTLSTAEGRYGKEHLISCHIFQ